MKGKTLLIKELQDAINGRLKQFDGRSFAGSEYHDWYGKEIMEELRERDINEMRPTTWGITSNISTAGFCMYSEIMAGLDIDFKRDKRFTRSTTGRGIINQMRIKFKDEIADATLDAARCYLLEKKRDELIAMLRSEKTRHELAAEECEHRIKDLAAAEF